MTSIPKFDSEIYSEELYLVTESEYDEVMQDSAVEDEGWQSYEQWSRKNEKLAGRSSKQINGILIKKACEHPTCSDFKCKCRLRIGGIEI